MTRTRTNKLTQREFEILSYFAYGASSKAEAANIAGIEIYTVKTHLQNIYQKLDVGKLHCAIAKVFPPSKVDYSLIENNCHEL